VGEDPLVATRLAIAAKRAQMERDADALRDALNVKKRFTENPPLFVGLAAGGLFLLAGGPKRVGKVIRRRVMPTRPEKAYDSLPKPLQGWVDQIAGSVGPRADEARQSLAEELMRWRHDPRKHGKTSKKLAEEMAKGPAGPKRTAWTAFEAASAILTAALARKVVERFLSSEPPTGHATLDTLGTIGGAAEPDPEKAKDDVTRSSSDRRAAAVADAAESGDGYSGMSARSG
jgi:hypothetical protein